MADQQNTIRTTVELDATQAQQEIVKLNAKASDSTKDLTERLEAKNKQIKIQEDLSKKTIKDLEEEAAKIKEVEGASGNYQRIQKKLNAERVKATRLSEANSKSQAKLAAALKDSENSTKRFDDATGGLLSKMKAFVANPIGLVVIALAGAFKLVSEAIGRSEKASAAFNKIGAKLSGLFNGLVAFITPVVELLGEALVNAIEKPKEAWDGFVDALEVGYNFVKQQVIDRFLGQWAILSGGFEAGVLKMRIAWNEFTGDSEEAEKLTEELDSALSKINEGVDLIKGANEAIIDVVTGAVDGVIKLGVEAAASAGKAAKATEALANAERALVVNRIALEKEQLKSLRLAEEERQIRDDTSKSIEERIAANQRLGQVLDEQLTRELALAQQQLDFARLEAQATGDTIENLERVGDAEIKLLEIRERITGQRSEQLTNENALLMEQKVLKEEEAAQAAEEAEKKKEEEEAERKRQADLLERDQEAQNELDELEIERLREQGGSVLDLELALLERKRMQDVMAAGLTAKEIEVINENAAAKRKQLLDAGEKAEKAKEDAVLESAINGAVEAFGIAQEVAVARMIMAAPQAVAGSFKQASLEYAPPLSLVMGALGAAGTVAPIIKGLADIKKTRFSKSKGGASPGGSANISASPSGSAVSTPNISPEIISDIAASNSANLGLDTDLGSNATSDASNNVRGCASNNVIFSETRYREFQDQVSFKEEKSIIS